MAFVQYVSSSGTERTCEVAAGASVMQTAIRNGVRGIDAECGGCLDCATCHVYVDETQLAALRPPSPQEEELLGAVAAERRPTSRLSCQLHVPAELETLVVHIPERQL